MTTKTDEEFEAIVDKLNRQTERVYSLTKQLETERAKNKALMEACRKIALQAFGVGTAKEALRKCEEME